MLRGYGGGLDREEVHRDGKEGGKDFPVELRKLRHQQDESSGKYMHFGNLAHLPKLKDIDIFGKVRRNVSQEFLVYCFLVGLSSGHRTIKFRNSVLRG